MNEADDRLLRALVLSPELVEVLCHGIDERNTCPKCNLFATAFYHADLTPVSAAQWLLRPGSSEERQRLGRQVLSILRSDGQVIPEAP